MAEFEGTVPIAGLITPTGTTDVYAVTDPIYGIDGFRNVPTKIERNAITTKRRRAGMVVGTQNDGKYWRLKNKITWDMDDSDWESWTLGANLTDKQIAFGNSEDNITSAINLIWDYTTGVFSVNDDGGIVKVSVDKTGVLKLYGDTISEYVGFKAPSGAGTQVYTLPITDGLPGYTLITDGSGNLSWSLNEVYGTKGFFTTITGNSIDTQWTVTHNLNSINVMVQVFENSTTKNIEVDIERTDVNTVTIKSSPALPTGIYTVLVSAMGAVGGTPTLPGGSDTSIQFNSFSAFAGDNYFQYNYNLPDNGKVVTLTAPWGTTSTNNAYQLYTEDIGATTRYILGIFGRESQDSAPATRSGALKLFSTYPGSSTLRVDLNANLDSSPYLRLYNTTGTTPNVHLATEAWIFDSLTLGNIGAMNTGKLAIKTIGSNIAINIHNSSNTSVATIDNFGSLFTSGTIKVGDWPTTPASPPTGFVTPGNIRYDSTTTMFYGYIGGISPRWIPFSGGVPASPDTSIQFNDGGVFGGSGNWTYTKTPVSVSTNRVNLKTEGNSGEKIEITGTYSSSINTWSGLKIDTTSATITDGTFKGIDISNYTSGAGTYQTFFSFTGIRIDESFALLNYGGSYSSNVRGIYINLNNIASLTYPTEEYAIQTILRPAANTAQHYVKGYSNEVFHRNNSTVHGNYIKLTGSEAKTTSSPIIGQEVTFQTTNLYSGSNLTGLYINGGGVVNYGSSSVSGIKIEGGFNFGLRTYITPGANTTFGLGHDISVTANTVNSSIIGVNIYTSGTRNNISSGVVYGIKIDSSVELNNSSQSYQGIYITSASMNMINSDSFNGLAITGGASEATSFKNSIYIENTTGNGVYVKVDGVNKAAISADGNAYLLELLGNMYEESAVPSTQDKRIRVNVNGDDYYIALFKI